MAAAARVPKIDRLPVRCQRLPRDIRYIRGLHLAWDVRRRSHASGVAIVEWAPAAILARTGDLTRFASARAVVKHASLAPREKISGSYTGRTKLTGQVGPGLRGVGWRAVWGAQSNNPVYAARTGT